MLASIRCRSGTKSWAAAAGGCGSGTQDAAGPKTPKRGRRRVRGGGGENARRRRVWRVRQSEGKKLARPRKAKAASGRRDGLQGLEITAQVAPRKLLPTRPMLVWGRLHPRQSPPVPPVHAHPRPSPSGWAQQQKGTWDLGCRAGLGLGSATSKHRQQITNGCRPFQEQDQHITLGRSRFIGIGWADSADWALGGAGLFICEMKGRARGHSSCRVPILHKLMLLVLRNSSR